MHNLLTLWADQNSRKVALDIFVIDPVDALTGKSAVGYDSGFFLQSPVSNGCAQGGEGFGAFHQHLTTGSIQCAFQISIGTGKDA